MNGRPVLLLSKDAHAPLTLVRSLASYAIVQARFDSRTSSLPSEVSAIVACIDGPESGIAVARTAAIRDEVKAPLIVVAEKNNESLAVVALRSGAQDYFSCPYDPALLSRAVRAATESSSSMSRASVNSLIGDSAGMRAVRSYIAHVAATECNVLITGATGTGKELVAQLIHGHSQRAQRPMICINCAAIPDSLLESELFGYERGAFTGANTFQPGKLGSAHGGTVFFDEIGDMTLTAQAKILRAIESHEIQRLGSRTSTRSDLRIIAATNRDLESLVAAKAFRSDLYFRLNIGRVELPPLRERKEDLIPLVDCFLAELNQRMSRSVRGVSGPAMELLLSHDWPGNVRELKNVVEAALISRASGLIEIDDLPIQLRRRPVEAAHSSLKSSVEERSQLLSALTACRWNKSKAAEKLNWSRMTLYRKLAKYRLFNPGQAAPVSRATLDSESSDGTAAPKRQA